MRPLNWWRSHSKLRMTAAHFGPYTISLFFALSLPFALSAQQPSAREANSRQSDSLGHQTTIKTKVRQVLIDVVVTDGKNHPIAGLRQQDFSVLEDGKPQHIVFFEAHTAASDAAYLKPPELPALPPNTFLNVSTARDNLPLNILLYDVLNTPIDDQPFAHRELVKFLNNKPAGSRFAIFVLSKKLHLLQGFTDDARQLVSAINRKEAGSFSATIYQSQEAAHDASSQLSESGVLPPNDPGAQAMLDRMQHMESIAGNYFLTRRVEQTIGAFVEIAKFVNGLPGRKNLIWLSGSFPAGIFPGSDPTDPFGTSVSYGAELRQAADLLTIGQVAVYPVDIRGLTINPVYGAANSRIYRSPVAFADAHARFGQQLAAEHDTMNKIAEDSGGHAFYDTNGLQKAIATGTDDGANYYTLSYSPTNAKFDGGLRKIRVALGQKGYHLAYRRSYLADDDSIVAEKTADASSAHLSAAMRRGAPPAHELLFEARLVPQGAPANATQEQIRQLTQFPAFVSEKKWETVQMQRYLINCAVLGRQLVFAVTPDGVHHGTLEFVFAAYDADGNTMAGQRSTMEVALSSKDFDKIQKGAYPLQQVLDIPSGAAWLRLGVRDAIGNRVGSMEIPLPLAPEAQTESNVMPP